MAGDSVTLEIPPDQLDRLRNARRVVVLTGAGVSAESGLATFRDPRTGYWSAFNPEEMASRQGFLAHPGRVWSWYALRRRQVAQVSPNAAHTAIAALQNYYPELTVVTQNVDGLHQRAGSRDVIELHGNISGVLCFEEHRPVDYTDGEDVDRLTEEALAREEWLEVPRCPRCGSPLRPDVVWFGELLPVGALGRAEDLIRACEVLLIAGTSGMVYPAAGLAHLARNAGALVVEVNPEASDISSQADIKLRGKAGEVLPHLAALITGAW